MFRQRPLSSCNLRPHSWFVRTRDGRFSKPGNLVNDGADSSAPFLTLQSSIILVAFYPAASLSGVAQGTLNATWPRTRRSLLTRQKSKTAGWWRIWRIQALARSTRHRSST